MHKKSIKILRIGKHFAKFNLRYSLVHTIVKCELGNKSKMPVMLTAPLWDASNGYH